MRSRIARVAVLALASLGLLATVAPPASATTIKKGVFVGTALITGGGLGYPVLNGGTDFTNCLTGTTVKAGPKGEPQVNLGTCGNGRSFLFNNLACIKLSISVKMPLGTGKTGLDNCAITATGSVTGYCGLSTGAGVVTLTNGGPVLGGPPSKGAIGPDPFKFTGIGGVLYVTGGNAATNLYAVVLAVPAVSIPTTTTTGSCTNKQATTFTIAGVFCYKDLTI